jgi:hypothetical protein
MIEKSADCAFELLEELKCQPAESQITYLQNHTEQVVRFIRQHKSLKTP